jgi:hypothetical protein
VHLSVTSSLLPVICPVGLNVPVVKLAECVAFCYGRCVFVSAFISYVRARVLFGVKLM